MPEIAGYLDRSYIKGQYYRYAASPKPVVFAGDIDDLSDDNVLLTKAMLVSRGDVTGALPNDSANTFLITTVKYGTNVYLQTAYVVRDNFNCWEYRRIYSGGWSDWVAVDAAIKEAKNDAELAVSTANAAQQAITGPNGVNSSLTAMTQTIGSLSSSVSAASNSAANASSAAQQALAKTAATDISTSYTIQKTGGDSKWNSAAVSAIKVGNVVNMQIEFGFNKGSWSAGSTPYTGTLSGGLLPIYPARLIAYYTSALIACTVSANGAVQVRIIGGTLAPGGSRDSTKVTGTFISNG